MAGKKKGSKKQMYIVEKILDKKIENGVVYYFLKWENYPSKDNTWEPRANLACQEMMKEFEDQLSKAERNKIAGTSRSLLTIKTEHESDFDGEDGHSDDDTKKRSTKAAKEPPKALTKAPIKTSAKAIIKEPKEPKKKKLETVEAPVVTQRQLRKHVKSAREQETASSSSTVASSPSKKFRISVDIERLDISPKVELVALTTEGKRKHQEIPGSPDPVESKKEQVRAGHQKSSKVVRGESNGEERANDKDEDEDLMTATSSVSLQNKTSKKSKRGKGVPANEVVSTPTVHKSEKASQCQFLDDELTEETFRKEAEDVRNGLKILNVTDEPGMYFQVQMPRPAVDVQLVPMAEANLRWPRSVIQFYEARLVFTTSHVAVHKTSDWTKETTKGKETSKS